jgi:hypothetical protein
MEDWQRHNLRVHMTRPQSDVQPSGEDDSERTSHPTDAPDDLNTGSEHTGRP